MNPLVSICIPTYNGALYLKQALDSVLQQTYDNLELIVSDDASTDGTLAIIKNFNKTSKLPIHIFHHEPKGIGANWNHCIEHANGKYIKFLFQDDILLPKCVETMVNVLESNKQISILACKRLIIHDPDYEPKYVSEWIERFGDLQKNLDLKYDNGICILDKGLFKHKQFLRSPLNKIGEPTTMMFRKDLIDQVGYFREDLLQILDYEFCYRVLKKQRIAILETPQVKFRLHGMQTSSINKTIKSKKENEGYTEILYKDYLEYLDPYMKRHLLKKHHFVFRVLVAIKAKMRQLLN